MNRILAAFACGLVFGVGLTVSQMINPAKVLGFLDVAAIPAGGWDPSLALVLLGATVTTLIGYRLVFRRHRPLFADAFTLPTRRNIDARLILGAILFGAGWGLVGLCPGPAVAVLGVDGLGAVVFILAMLAGMVAYRSIVEKGFGG
ncbi:MAG: YeeE/YedE family protein [Rhodospirillales bacterium]|jgi:uncharacterized membrane protein YedE/YeeE|nr:YeeE/YedE family protein [Rhodospirillales bacterium]